MSTVLAAPLIGGPICRFSVCTAGLGTFMSFYMRVGKRAHQTPNDEIKMERVSSGLFPSKVLHLPFLRKSTLRRSTSTSRQAKKACGIILHHDHRLRKDFPWGVCHPDSRLLGNEDGSEAGSLLPSSRDTASWGAGNGLSPNFGVSFDDGCSTSSTSCAHLPVNLWSTYAQEPFYEGFWNQNQLPQPQCFDNSPIPFLGSTGAFGSPSPANTLFTIPGSCEPLQYSNDSSPLQHVPSVPGLSKGLNDATIDYSSLPPGNFRDLGWLPTPDIDLAAIFSQSSIYTVSQQCLIPGSKFQFQSGKATRALSRIAPLSRPKKIKGAGNHTPERRPNRQTAQVLSLFILPSLLRMRTKKTCGVIGRKLERPEKRKKLTHTDSHRCPDTIMCPIKEATLKTKMTEDHASRAPTAIGVYLIEWIDPDIPYATYLSPNPSLEEHKHVR
ncbi:hypothetical protein PG995_005062 [Apiospora arundinis]